MSTTELTAILAQKDAWNAAHPVGTTVRYWIGARVGEGTVAKTTGPASAMSGRAVVYVAGRVGRAVELALVEVVGGDEVPKPEPISAPPAPEADPLSAALSAFEALRPFLCGTFHAVPVSREYGEFLVQYDGAVEQLRADLLLPARRGGGG